MKMTIKLVAYALFIAVFMPQLHAEQLEAKQDGVKVTAEPKKDSAEVATLKKGQAIEGLDRKGMFWRVKMNGKEGYVSFMSVSRKAESSSALASAINKAAQETRDMDNVKGARSRSAVMGIRGLDETTETASAGNVAPNLRMVFNMEDREMSQKRVEKLGELVQREIENRVERKTK